MAKSYFWRKGIFSHTHNLYFEGEKIGYVKENSWNMSGIGVIRDKKYRFTIKGVFHQESEIIDRNDNKVLGNIKYSSWFSKAKIELNGQKYQWKSQNGFKTRWQIIRDNTTLVKFSGGSHKGTIQSDEDQELLIILGLFVNNYYTQFIALIIIFIIVFVII